MGIALNGLKCNKCNEEFDIALEWRSKNVVIEKIKKTRCPKCGSNDFYFTDEMGQ